MFGYGGCDGTGDVDNAHCVYADDDDVTVNDNDDGTVGSIDSA